MELGVGEIVSGKVTGITKFGAFVSLPEGKTGLVHISEVGQTYVSNIRDHLTEGQEVKVKVIAIDETGRVNLSIKKAMPRTENTDRRQSYSRSGEGGGYAPHGGAGKPRTQTARSGGGKAGFSARRQPQKAEPETFEDRLKVFMQDSESRMADIRHNRDKKTGSRRRK